MSKESFEKMRAWFFSEVQDQQRQKLFRLWGFPEGMPTYDAQVVIFDNLFSPANSGSSAEEGKI